MGELGAANHDESCLDHGLEIIPAMVQDKAKKAHN